MSDPGIYRKDVSPVLAVLGLIGVVGVYLILQAPAASLQWLERLEREYTLEGVMIWAGVGSLSLNLVALYSVLYRSLGLNRRGSRLEVLTGRKSASLKTSQRVFLICSAGALLTFMGLWAFGYPGRTEFLPLDLSWNAIQKLSAAFRTNFTVSGFVILWMASRLPAWNGFTRRREKDLPEMPRPENGIVLGSVGDDDPERAPSWAVSTWKALTGNILITGSIGGGKTAGSVVPYVDQILSNFNPRPAILAIDPKGTFIPVLRKLIEERGLSQHVLHLRLGGDVTFNPIYTPNSLKNGRFLDTAQMIRAAAVNFMGKSFDSPFWEISAFNLIKNCLVLCGAKYAA